MSASVATPGPSALTCLACGSAKAEVWTSAGDAEYKTTNDRFTIYRCAACGALFIGPVPRERLSEIYPANYYSFADQTDSFVQKIKKSLDRRLFGKILQSIPGKSLNALDIGGGSGWQMNVLRELDPRMSLTQVVDFDPAAAERAKLNGHRYFCGRIEDFKTDTTFDLVLMLNLIEHVENPLEILTNVRKMLSPKGRIIIKTPNHESLDATVFRNHNWGGLHCPRHWVIFTKDSFTAIAAKAGLRVIEFSYTQGAPFWASSILFRLDKWGLVSITKERPVVYHPLFPLLSAFFAAVDFARRPFAKTSQMFFILGKSSDL